MSKLHIPSPSSFAATTCGRQLNNHRSAKAQDAANATVAGTLEQYMAELSKGKACRHCGRVAGILPALKRPVRTTAELDEEQDSYEN